MLSNDVLEFVQHVAMVLGWFSVLAWLIVAALAVSTVTVFGGRRPPDAAEKRVTDATSGCLEP